MEFQLARRWWMGALVAAVGALLLVLNLQQIQAEGPGRVSLLSTASAAFAVVLGWALVVQPVPEDE